MSTLISRLYDWVTDKTNSVKITASKQDDELDQLVAALNQKVLCSASAPSSPIAGQTWIDTTNKLLKIYLNNEWVVHGPVHIGSSAPATPFEGMLWYDTTNNLLEAYNGSAWTVFLIVPSSSAQGDLIYLSAANTPARLAKSATATRILMNTGTDNNPAWNQAGYQALTAVLAAWADKSADYGAQQAATDGFLVVLSGTTNQNSIYTDGNADPTTKRGACVSVSGYATSAMIPVRKGDYWKVVVDGGSGLAIYWLPLGS